MELIMLPINHGTSHGETNRMHINILYVEHYIYNNVEYYIWEMYIYIYIWVETIKLLIISKGITNLIQNLVEPYMHNKCRIIYMLETYTFVIHILYVDYYNISR